MFSKIVDIADIANISLLYKYITSFPPKLLLLSTTIRETLRHNMLQFFRQYLWFSYLSVNLCIYVCLIPHANMVPLHQIETYSVTLWFLIDVIMLPLFCYSLFLSGCFFKTLKSNQISARDEPSFRQRFKQNQTISTCSKDVRVSLLFFTFNKKIGEYSI